MGGILSRFRKQPTTLEQLKKIEDSLQKIDDYKRNTEKKQKRTVANVIIYGAALYILACVIVFVWYLPESWLVRLVLLIPLVLVPVIIYWMKRLISRYFQSKMSRANEDYEDLKRKKKDIIDSVMETETFNKAKEILSKYAPERLEKKLQERNNTQSALDNTVTSDLRKRNSASSGTSSTALRPVQPQQPLPRSPLRSSIEGQYTLSNRLNTALVSSTQLPRPLFPKERSFSDKLVEYIVGDGPGYRFALICKFCKGHNGMALQEEFPYLSFMCCYCRKLNAARSQRPVAPRLPDSVQPPALLASDAKSLDVQRHLDSGTEQEITEEIPRRSNINAITSKLDSKASKLDAKNSKASVENNKLPLTVPFDEFIHRLEQSQDSEVLNSGNKSTLHNEISDVRPTGKSENLSHNELGSTEMPDSDTVESEELQENLSNSEGEEQLETPAQADDEREVKDQRLSSSKDDVGHDNRN